MFVCAWEEQGIASRSSPPNPNGRTSSVARKAAMSWVGSFWMNPTVSVRRISGKEPWNCGSASLLLVSCV